MQALWCPPASVGCWHHHQQQHHKHKHRHKPTQTRSIKQSMYEILGVSYDADAGDIRTAFRTKAKLLHPDVNKAADAAAAFRRLKRAYEVLSDSNLRASHDAQLREQVSADSSDAAAALRASDPRFARFERWRREIWPDLNAQLDVWTQEVMGVLRAAESALVLQEQQYRAAMVRAAPSAASTASLDWLNGGDNSSSGSSSSSQQELQAIVFGMKDTLAEATANVQRLYNKRYDQMPNRFPAYPDIVWYDRWLEVSDGWLDESGELVARWTPKIAAAAQWLPRHQTAQQQQQQR